MSTFFAVGDLPADARRPGRRFAVVTLCRYAVLGGRACLPASPSIHLGPEKIGVVLAALGRRARVRPPGDRLELRLRHHPAAGAADPRRRHRHRLGHDGKVDRINIRATTITNGDNQSIIVPNRAFITSDLINWTLKDKIIRVSIRVKVAHGTDPDRVTELLLSIAREDADVLRNPVPSAFMEDFSDSALIFVLYVHVPDPSLGGRVRHRLLGQIQRRFQDAGIEIPLPTQELRLKSAGKAPPPAVSATRRTDQAAVTPPAPPPHRRAEDRGTRGRIPPGRGRVTAEEELGVDPPALSRSLGPAQK